MLISYRSIKGKAIIIWVTTSGGVKIAAKTKNKSRAYFLFFFKNSTVTMPSLARNVIISGSSKTSPKASSNFEEKLKYSRMDGRGWIVSVANPKKNLNPNGKTIKYPNNAPPIKKKEERKTIGIRSFFSLP